MIDSFDMTRKKEMHVWDIIKDFDNMIQLEPRLQDVELASIDLRTLRTDLIQDEIDDIITKIINGKLNVLDGGPVRLYKVGEKFYLEGEGNKRISAFKKLDKKYIVALVTECQFPK